MSDTSTDVFPGQNTQWVNDGEALVQDTDIPFKNGTLTISELTAFRKLRLHYKFRMMRYIVLQGGKGSGKTKWICQELCRRMITETNKTFLIMCKTNQQLVDTIYLGDVSITDTLDAWGQTYKHQRGVKNILINGNKVMFRSMDDPKKVRSMEANYVWLEEANRFTAEDFLELNTRLRSPINDGLPNQIFLSYNPTSIYFWAIQWFIANPIPLYRSNALIHVSTPLCNPFLTDEYIDALIAQGDMDENKFKSDILGVAGVPLGLIYRNFKVLPEGDFPRQVWDQTPYYAIDWGFNDPLVLLEGRKYDGTWYIRQHFYQSKVQVEDMIAYMNKANVADAEPRAMEPRIEDYWNDTVPSKMEEVVREEFRLDHEEWEVKMNQIIPIGVPKGATIFCDAADPGNIDKVRKAGWNAIPAMKEVLAGIDTVQSSRVVISAQSEAVLEESGKYTWKPHKGDVMRDKDEPIGEWNHAMDCIRYMIHTYDRMNAGDVFVGKAGGHQTLRQTFYTPPMTETEKKKHNPYVFSAGGSRRIL